MKRFGYHLLALAVVAIWGVTFISTKVLIGAGLLPAQIFAIRFTIAYAGIWILCSRRPESRRLLSGTLKEELLYLLLGITGGSLYFLTENTALACTQACNVSFIVCSAPLITALLTIFFKRRFHGPLSDGLEDVSGRWQLVLGSALALFGMAAVIFEGGAPDLASAGGGQCPQDLASAVAGAASSAVAGAASSAVAGAASSAVAGAVSLRVKGDLLALAAATCWGIYSIFMGQMTSRHGALFATRKVFFYGLLTILPFLSLPQTGTSFFQILLQPVVWGNLLFLSVAASLLCFVLWNKVMSKIGNVTATNYVYLNPFFTLVFAVIFLGESLTLQSGLGCAAILAGVIIGGMRK